MKHPLFDPLRGLAALWVVAYHLQAGSPAAQGVPVVSALAGAGFLGVPMFFVISGFCLAAAARRALDEARPASEFLGRRLWRIYPPFWYSVLFAAVLSPLAFAPSLDGWLRLLSLGQVFDPSHERVIDRFKELNAPCWSLAIEAQFYLVVALALWLRPRFFAVLAGATALSLLAWGSPALLASGGVPALLAAVRPGPGPARDPAPGLDAPAAGGAAPPPGRPRPGRPRPGRHPGRIGWSYGFHPSGLSRGQPNVVAFAVLFAALLWLACDWDFSARAPAWIARPALLLGAMSYSVYLIHEPARVLLQSLLRPWLGGSPLAFGLAVLAGILAICWPFHLLCERPFAAPRSAVPHGAPVPAAA